MEEALAESREEMMEGMEESEHRGMMTRTFRATRFEDSIQKKYLYALQHTDMEDSTKYAYYEQAQRKFPFPRYLNGMVLAGAALLLTQCPQLDPECTRDVLDTVLDQIQMTPDARHKMNVLRYAMVLQQDT